MPMGKFTTVAPVLQTLSIRRDSNGTVGLAETCTECDIANLPEGVLNGGPIDLVCTLHYLWRVF